MTRALAAIFLTLTACSTMTPPLAPPRIVQLPPVVERVNVYPDVPATDLTCKVAPPPAIDIKDDVGFALYNNMVIDAWTDCFTKIQTLNRLVGTWPGN